ncbi:Mediator of RNA polymerase II transcription subunit 5 [Sphaceloma murrayae]|uniref:Mediator of RNA polymerase II transcription subunit 5 n=1 Tax=Sphaceloma murrayae TaxID=2082308 RepID=A0A2K1QYD1_9PEZI|nr:Mediator of RNA polymerase II transcription subunit 5 [Sphaceloma murrayae]
MTRDRPRDSDALEKWRTALTTCFVRRLRPSEVEDALDECQKSFRVSSSQLADLLVRSGARNEACCDPILPAYVSHFLKKSYLQPADLLLALLDTSPYKPRSAEQQDTLAKSGVSQAAHDSIFAFVSSPYASGEYPRSSTESVRTFRALLSYVQAYNAFETVQQIDNPGNQVPDMAFVAAFEHLGAFVVILLNNVKARRHLMKSIPKGAKSSIASSLNQFATTLSQWSQSSVHQKLQAILRMPPLVEQNEDGSLNFTAAEIAMNVADIPRTNSRCGMYAYFNAALCHRPLVDDLHILSFLQTRYGEDHQGMISDLITGAFDALMNALHRHESPHMVMCHRSFITNKMHGLISSLAINHLYQPGMTDQCIQIAMTRIDTHPFPPLSSDSAGINDTIKDVRQEFVQACQAYQLISENTATAILGGAQLSKVPSTPRPNKNILIQQLISNPQKADDLINDLDRMYGDAGNISNALVEAFRHSAASKETISLKILCTSLCRKLSSVDIILQHARLSDLLHPVCSYLNDWTHDEDQSELQPAYEDFAAILLFVFSIVHRYEVGLAELDGYDRSSFIMRFLNGRASVKHDLSSDEKKILGKWIKGLFAVDEKGESSGITDETMSGCSPQAFYLLVPSLFEQIILAVRSKALAPNTLKGGLEFLLEPFLLPSLIGGCEWLADHALANSKDADIALQIMHKLLKPVSISGDAQMMHTTILGTLYQSLRPRLTELDKRTANRKDIPQLIAVLKPHAASQYSTHSLRSEEREWLSASGTLRGSLSELITQLTTWSNNSDMISIPTRYTHRTVEAVVDKYGAEEVLKIMIDDVATQTAIGFGSWALDVVTSLICAPNRYNTFQMPSPNGARPSDVTEHCTIHEALKRRVTDSRFLLSLEQGKAETLIRLGRLVEAQSALIDMPLLNSMQLTIPTGDLMEGIDSAAVADAAVAASALETTDQATLDAAAADFSAAMDQTIDLSGGSDLNMGDASDLGLNLGDDLFGGDSVNFDLSMDTSGGMVEGQPQQGQQAGQSNDDDIFAGIDLGIMGDDDFGF